MDTKISQSPKSPWLIAIFYTQKFSLNQKIRKLHICFYKTIINRDSL